MSKWKKYSVSELCSDIIDCVNKTAPIADTETPYKMLRTSDIRDGFINIEGLNCVTEEVFQKWIRRGKLQVGDIVFTREAPLGEVGLVREATNYFLGQRLVLYRTDSSVCDNRFLMYWFLNPVNKAGIKSRGVGATVTHLRVPECEKIEITAPSIDIQHRIADILSSYDDLIENNRKQIKLLEEAAQRLYKEWFVDLRFPGHEETPIVDGVPAGWRKETISEVCETIGGGTPSTSKSEYYQNGTIPWATPTDLTKNNCLVLLDTEKKITEIGLNNSSAKLLPCNSLLMTSRASIGYFALCDFQVCTNQGFISCIPHNSDMLYYLLFNLMNRVDEIKGKATGSTFLEISKREFRNMEIIEPTEFLLKIYKSNIDPMVNKIRILKKEILHLTQARDRLLPKLMSGEIEV